jgi:hypothetical protein
MGVHGKLPASWIEILTGIVDSAGICEQIHDKAVVGELMRSDESAIMATAGSQLYIICKRRKKDGGKRHIDSWMPLKHGKGATYSSVYS